MKKLITIFATIALAACTAATAPEDVASDSAALANDDGEANACMLAPAGGHSRCDGQTEYDASYVAVDPPLDTGTTDRAAAEAICARYLIAHGSGTGLFGDGAADCGKCPSGSKGCEPNSFRMTAGFLRDPVTGNWSCGGAHRPTFKYKCSRCVIDGTACSDVASVQED